MSTAAANYRQPRSWLVLAAFIVVVLGIGAWIGTISVPGEWYQSLEKPPFNPPNWVFGPVWSTLYVLIAIAGWRTWMMDRSGAAMKFWFGQMLLNWIWSPVWFIAHMPWLAFVIIVALMATIIGFIVSARKRDLLAAWLFAPYLAWVAFASALNLSIAVMN